MFGLTSHHYLVLHRKFQPVKSTEKLIKALNVEATINISSSNFISFAEFIENDDLNSNVSYYQLELRANIISVCPIAAN